MHKILWWGVLEILFFHHTRNTSTLVLLVNEGAAKKTRSRFSCCENIRIIPTFPTPTDAEHPSVPNSTHRIETWTTKPKGSTLETKLPPET